MKFIFETGVLKRAARTGWWFAGVTQPESIADHSFRTAIVGMMLAAMEGADPAKVTMLCVLHDTQETRTTDLPHIAKRYLTAAPNTAITADQVADCPPAVADVITAAVAEYEAGETLEAVVARDADKLELPRPTASPTPPSPDNHSPGSNHQGRTGRTAPCAV